MAQILQFNDIFSITMPYCAMCFSCSMQLDLTLPCNRSNAKGILALLISFVEVCKYSEHLYICPFGAQVITNVSI